jgi:hypothetical protein
MIQKKPQNLRELLGLLLVGLVVLYAVYKYTIVPWDMTPAQKRAYFERQERVSDGGAYYPGR